MLIVSQPSRREELSKPARIMLKFIGAMLVVLTATLLLGELNLPYYGATAWELAGVALAHGVQGIIAAADWAARNFVVVTGAVGTVWLSRIHLQVRQKGQYKAGGLDVLLVTLSLALFVVYFAHFSEVLPPKAAVLYRVALFCAIALPMFGVTAMVSELWDDGLGGVLLMALVSGVVTGFLCCENVRQEVSYRALNPALHTLANLGAYVMALVYQYEAGKLKRAAEKASNASSATDDLE